MKELLQKLTRDELLDLGEKYINNFSNKTPNHIIVNQLIKIGISDEDKAWIEKLIIDEEANNLPSKDVNNIHKPKVREEYTTEIDGEKVMLSTNEINMKAKTKGNQTISNLVAEAKKKAKQMVIVHITPLSKEDISINKQAESFVTGNAYFTISYLVPFNVYVEVPLAIAEIIKEATCLNVVQLSQYEQKNTQFHPMAIGTMGRRYNVQIWTKEEFAKIQERQSVR